MQSLRATMEPRRHGTFPQLLHVHPAALATIRTIICSVLARPWLACTCSRLLTNSHTNKRATNSVNWLFGPFSVVFSVVSVPIESELPQIIGTQPREGHNTQTGRGDPPGPRARLAHAGWADRCPPRGRGDRDRRRVGQSEGELGGLLELLLG